MQHCRLKLWLQSLLLFVVWGVSTQVFGSENQLCKHHFRTKQYQRAAQCFRDLARQVEQKSPQLNIDDRIRAGAYYRNASLAFRRAAKQTKSQQESLYFYEKALSFVQRILDKGYHEHAAQKRLVVYLKNKLFGNIGYINLTVLTENPRTQMEVSGGYRFKTQKLTSNQMKLKLRAGTYTILVKYPSQSHQSKLIKLRKGQQAIIVSFRLAPLPKQLVTKRNAPPLSTSFRTTSFVVAGVGAATLFTGGILLGSSLASKTQADREAQDLQTKRINTPSETSRQDTLKIRDGIQGANAQLTAGAVLGGTGFLVGIAGIVMYSIYAQRKVSPPPPKPNTQKKTVQITQ